MQNKERKKVTARLQASPGAEFSVLRDGPLSMGGGGSTQKKAEPAARNRRPAPGLILKYRRRRPPVQVDGSGKSELS
jgi:hypothetical protein